LIQNLEHHINDGSPRFLEAERRDIPAVEQPPHRKHRNGKALPLKPAQGRFVCRGNLHHAKLLQINQPHTIKA
jgi:hypothetical protein